MTSLSLSARGLGLSLLLVFLASFHPAPVSAGSTQSGGVELAGAPTREDWMDSVVRLAESGDEKLQGDVVRGTLYR